MLTSINVHFQPRAPRDRKRLSHFQVSSHVVIAVVFYICLSVCRFVKGNILLCRKCTHCSVLSKLKSARIVTSCVFWFVNTCVCAALAHNAQWINSTLIGGTFAPPAVKEGFHATVRCCKLDDETVWLPTLRSHVTHSDERVTTTEWRFAPWCCTSASRVRGVSTRGTVTARRQDRLLGSRSLLVIRADYWAHAKACACCGHRRTWNHQSCSGVHAEASAVITNYCFFACFFP